MTALIVFSPAAIVPLSVNRFPNKLVPNIPNKTPRNQPFCYFVLFLIVSLTLFINKPDSLSYWTIFMASFIASFEIIIVSLLDPNIVLWIAASVANAAAVNSNDIKTLLANGLNMFFIKDNPNSSNGPKDLPKNPFDCPNLCSWVFDNFILAE